MVGDLLETDVRGARAAGLFGVLVTRGTPTYVSTTDLVVDLVINQF